MLKKYLFIIFLSMVPLVELRGAIPFAYGFKAADPAFNMTWAYIIIAVGNMLPVPVIFFFARKVLEWGKDKKYIGKFFTFCLEKGHKCGEKLKAKAGKGLFVALLLFVGIPIPGTGAWTGTLAASLLDMDFKSSVLAVILGVALAGIIVSVVCLLGFGAWLGIATA
ncbi:MAG: small multi-drug export protein [Lachnospiraceae bacterium]|nr:small multi-drug export protein [Lachnospiraceae bacterium]